MKAWILSSQTQGDWVSSSTEVLCRSAKLLSIDVEIVRPEHLHFAFSHEEKSLYRNGQLVPISDYPDVVLPRFGWNSLEQGLRACEMLENLFSLKVVNNSQSIVLCSDKLKQLLVFAKEEIPIVKTHWASPTLNSGFHFTAMDSLLPLENKKQELGKKINLEEYVVKTLKGSQGYGVTFHPNVFSARAQVDCLRTLEADFILQSFVKTPEPVHDLRIFMVVGQPVAAMKRFAAEGEFRSNLHQGGNAEKIELGNLPPELVQISIQCCKSLSLWYGAVDFIQGSQDLKKYFVLEVNAFPGLVGISSATSVDVASKLWESLLLG